MSNAKPLTEAELAQLREEIADGIKRAGYDSVVSAEFALRMLATIDDLQEQVDSAWRQFNELASQ